MKCNSSILNGWKAVILTVMFILCALFEPAYSETGSTVLLLQQTPVQGGTVTPDIGVHHFDLHTDVTLTAVPKPGFQFVYWLGDVSDPIANRTVVYLDAPKIVIAIFERTEYEFLVVEESVQSSPGGGLLASAPDYARQGYRGSGSRKPEEPSPPNGKPKDDDFPVPIPEPATVCLLALGGLCLLCRKRKRYIFGGKQK